MGDLRETVAELERLEALEDNFHGDTANLLRSIEALIALDRKGVLVPHGIGGHARELLSSAAVRLAAAEAREEALKGIFRVMASQSLSEQARKQYEEDFGDDDEPDFEGAYDVFILSARAALAPTETK